MGTKVVIFDVDLGISVDDIISENVAALTGRAKEQLDTAIEDAKLVQRVKLEKEESAKKATDKITQTIIAAYEAILAAGENGLAVSSAMSLTSETVTNPTAFALRMKTILAEKGNQYVLSRKKVHGTPHYVFIPFNDPSRLE